MTGHLLYGTYKYHKTNPKNSWEPIEPEALKDPFNRHLRFVISFDNKKFLALADVRKFAKVALISTETIHNSSHLSGIGPEPLNDAFTFKIFNNLLNSYKNKKIKQVLLDQAVIAGIGNIYADESLWRAEIHPAQLVKNIDFKKRDLLHKAIKTNLSKGISLGGDSMSDYRNVDGEKGKFQETHHAYRKTGLKCDKKGCKGIIRRIVVAGRGTHYCDKHQILSN